MIRLHAVHRFQEAGWTAVVAAPSKRRLHLVMHDFEPGWDTYVERPGNGWESDIGRVMHVRRTTQRSY